MNLAVLRPALAGCAMVIASAALAADPGAVRDFRDWTVACDNAGACRAHGFPPGGTSSGFGLRVDRGAGPAAPVRIHVGMDQAWQPPTAGTVTFATERGPIRSMPLRSAFRTTGGDYEIADPAVVEAIVAAIRHNRQLRITFAPVPQGAEGPVPPVSLDGASAALLWMDERQQRVGTVTAIARRGSQPAAAVPPAPPLPAAPAPRPLATGDATPALSAGTAAAVMTRFRREFEDTCDVDEDPDAADEDLTTVRRLTGGLLLVGVRCWRGAYNLSRAYFLVEDGATPRVRPAAFPRPVAPVEGSSPVPDNILTNADIDAATGRISHFSKGRGPGDCGERGEWGWDGTRLHAVSIDIMPHCRGIVDAWFSLYRTR